MLEKVVELTLHYLLPLGHPVELARHGRALAVHFLQFDQERQRECRVKRCNRPPSSLRALSAHVVV